MQVGALGTLKWAFYDWMGALSIKEIITNKDLMSSVEGIQKILVGSKAGREHKDLKERGEAR